MLDKEYNYYLQNQNNFVKRYKGKFLVIKDEKVVGVYNTREAAYDMAVKKFRLGTFLIQECLEKNSDITQAFHSRAIFN